jgi:hypothetical protein
VLVLSGLLFCAIGAVRVEAHAGADAAADAAAHAAADAAAHPGAESAADGVHRVRRC